MGPTGLSGGRLPDGAYADRGHDGEPLGHFLRWQGVEPHIAKSRTPHGSGPGEVGRVVGGTIAWLKGPRRMRVGYDRLGVIRDAWTTLAAGIIRFRIPHHDVMLMDRFCQSL